MSFHLLPTRITKSAGNEVVIYVAIVAVDYFLIQLAKRTDMVILGKGRAWQTSYSTTEHEFSRIWQTAWE